MNADAILLVSGATVTLVTLLKTSAFMTRYALLVVFMSSALGVWLWGMQEHITWLESIFDLFVGWLTCATSAAGVFGLIRATPDQVTAFRKPAKE